MNIQSSTQDDEQEVVTAQVPLVLDDNHQTRHQQQTMDKWTRMKNTKPILYSMLLMLVCAASFSSMTLQAIFFKKMADDLPHGAYFLLLMVALVSAIILLLVKFCRDMLFWILAKIRKQTNSNASDTLEHWQLAILGVLSATSSVMLQFAAHPTAPALQPILAQSSIPFTFVLSYLLKRDHFKIKYFVLELMTTSIVAIGVAISLIPIIIAIAADPSSIASKHSIIWPLVFLFSFVPLSLATVLQEKYCKQKENLDYLHLLAWIAIYTTVVVVLMIGLNFVVPSMQVHTFADLGATFDQGFRCILLGQDVMVNGTITEGNCHMAALDFSLFNGGVLGVYLFASWLLIMASSLFFTLSITLVAPASTIIFALLGMDEITWFTIVAMIVMLVGVVSHTIVDYFKTKAIVTMINDSSEQKHLLDTNLFQ